jgi:hypothetical protein
MIPMKIRIGNKNLSKEKENVNWEYISKLPSRLQKGLFCLLDTGNLHIAADNAGVPIDVINVHRKKADIILVVEK